MQFPVKAELSDAAMVNVSGPPTVVMGFETALMAVMRLDVQALLQALLLVINTHFQQYVFAVTLHVTTMQTDAWHFSRHLSYSC